MANLSQKKIKLIHSLSQKKYRDKETLFVAEGTKIVFDLLSGFSCIFLFATNEWLCSHSSVKADECLEVSEQELKKIAVQTTPQGVVAVFRKPTYRFDLKDISNKLSLALDDVQDPGNLGTIIRIADWLGIENIFCSEHCADAFGSKTVQATMGALARVKVHNVSLPDFLKSVQELLPIYGTTMDGADIYSSDLRSEGIIVMGNEGNGISPSIRQLLTDKLLIPNFPKGVATSESLNVGVATALVCAEFRRRQR